MNQSCTENYEQELAAQEQLEEKQMYFDFIDEDMTSYYAVKAERLGVSEG